MSYFGKIFIKSVGRYAMITTDIFLLSRINSLIFFHMIRESFLLSSVALSQYRFFARVMR